MNFTTLTVIFLFINVKQSLTSLPGAVQQVERALHTLPVLQVEEGVGDGFAVPALQDVLRRQNQTLHL